MNLKRSLFVLPNLFTASSIFCGFWAITELASPPLGAHSFYRAAIAICFALIFDMCDGRVARLTKTQSAFGLQMDSLADAVSFGIAPALLVYKWALEPYGFYGILVSFAFACCGILRLARFNVIAESKKDDPRFFIGLPIPVAAGLIIALVIAHSKLGGGVVQSKATILVLLIILSYLMVSNIRFRTFKKLSRSDVKLLLFGFVFIAMIIVLHKRAFSFGLVAMLSTYIAIGLVEEVIFFPKRMFKKSQADSQNESDDNDSDELIEEDELNT